MKSSVPRIAIIGCGAVTEFRHLPALAALKITPTLLVDINLNRAQKLADEFHVPRASEDYRPYLGEFDAAIVATPHHLHAPACTDLLRRGVHVLVEKPLAVTVAECNAITAAAEEGRAVLSVGLMRRFRPDVQWVKAALDAAVIGQIESFDIREGYVYAWPVASSFMFRKEAAGGGVLLDLGAHTLDLLLWWLGDAASFEYYDDSYGGVEAECELRLKMQSGARGVLEMSRTRDLRNTAIIRGARGEIELDFVEQRNLLTARPKELLAFCHGAAQGNRLPQLKLKELFVEQIRGWLRAIKTKGPPAVSGAEAARSVALMKACYERRQSMVLPWMTPNLRQVAVSQARSK
jgi:predicted dehydrogenase